MLWHIAAIIDATLWGTRAMTTAAPDRERIKTSGMTSAPVEIWLLIVLFVALSTGIFLRFNNLDGKVCWYDECFSRIRVAGFARPDLSEFLLSAQRPIPVGEATSFMHWRFNSKAPLPYLSILREDFQNSALYYWAGRVWVGLFGETIASLRYFSIVTSLVSLPLLFMLCHELFGSRRTAWITVGIMASAPAFVIYAQQIRNYDIWIFTVLLAGLMLLRATRRNRFGDWAGYSACLFLSLLTSPLSIPVAVGHAVFVAWRARWQFAREVKAFVLSGLVASLALVPRVLLGSYDVICSAGIGWLGVPPKGGLPEYLWSPVKNIARIFGESTSLGGNPALVAFSIAILALVVFALIQIHRHASRDQRLFVYTLVFSSFLALVMRDAIVLGRSATITRYLFPTLIGVVIAVGYLFARMTSPRAGKDARLARGLWIGLFVVFLSSALIAAAKIISKPTSWATWPDVSATVPECAALVNKVADPVVVIPWQGRATIPLVLGDKLKATAKIIPVDDDAPQWKSILEKELDARRNVLLWDPLKFLSAELGSRPELSVRSIDSRQALWTVSLKPYRAAFPSAGKTPAN